MNTFLEQPAERLADWRADFQQMLGPMFFGEVPTFDEMIATAAAFAARFNATATTSGDSSQVR